MKHRILPVVGLALIFLGLLGAGDAAMNKWGSGEVITGVIGNVRQHQLKRKFEAQQKVIIKKVYVPAAATEKSHRHVAQPIRFPWPFHSGDPVMRIDIPRIHLSTIVIEGTNADDLSRGPGRIIGTGTFGQNRRMGIAGHRTTWSHPFRHVDQLRRGDRIRLTAYGRTIVYSVEGQLRVRPTAIGVLKGKGLVLTTCDPPGSAAYRRIIVARKLTTPTQ